MSLLDAGSQEVLACCREPAATRQLHPWCLQPAAPSRRSPTLHPPPRRCVPDLVMMSGMQVVHALGGPQCCIAGSGWQITPCM